MARIRVLLADDHKMFGDALASLLRESFELLGVVRDGRLLVEEATRLKPDVIVTDAFMPKLNGIDAARQIKSHGLASKIIVLTLHPDPSLAADAFRAGAVGFVSKDSAGQELIEAIQYVSQGRAYLTPLIAKNVIDLLLRDKSSAGSSKPDLTPRQREVLQLVAEGRTMKEVADVLGISVRTAEGHRYETMESLGVQTTAELVQWAIRLGLISVS